VDDRRGYRLGSRLGVKAAGRQQTEQRCRPKG
jgi:hypothetical protein